MRHLHLNINRYTFKFETTVPMKHTPALPRRQWLRHLLNSPALFKLPHENPGPLKRLPAFLPLLLGLLLLLGGCKDLFGIKEDPIPVPPPSLPLATQIGANTFGCYVDSQLWLPQGSGLGIVLSADYDNAKRILHLYADNSLRKEAFYFDIFNIPNRISSQITLSLGAENDSIGFSQFVKFYDAISFYKYRTSSTLGGFLNISKFDDGLGVVSGTFNFKAINELGDTIDVRYGRFDLKTHY